MSLLPRGRWLRRACWTALSAALLATLLAFPYGPLIAWSPTHPGYAAIESRRAKLLYPAGTTPQTDLRELDEILERAERFHGLKQLRRVTVVWVRDWNDFDRFLPLPRRRLMAGVTVFAGRVVYITPKAAERGLDSHEFIRHELSHALLHQRMSVSAGFCAARQEWLLEGLAVSFAAQKSFVTPSEFLARARGETLLPIIDPAERSELAGLIDYRFAYQSWRYFLEYLMEDRGRDAFQRFLSAYLARPEAYQEIFAARYGLAFDDEIRRFERSIRASNWSPNPEFAAARTR
jgi:hypothetical protein